MVQLSHPYMTNGKTIAFTRQTFISTVMSLLFKPLLPKSKHLLISWLKSPPTVILEENKENMKSVTVPTVSPSICHEVMGPDAMFFIFWMLSYKPAFSFFSFTCIKRLISSSLLSVFRVASSAYLRLLIFFLAILIPTWASSCLAFHMIYSA